MSEQSCRHCGDRIVPFPFLGRPGWTHQPAGAAFQDDQHWHCHRTVAEPHEGDGRAESHE